LGLPVGRFLPYVTGGLAYAHTESGENCPPGATGGWCQPSRHGPFNLSKSEDSWGWTAGGGIEGAITEHWSIKGEYLYVDLGKETHVLDPDFETNKNIEPMVTASDRNADWTLHTVRVGINYRP
jgi:outer membrane immunogenic protein